MKRRSNNLKKKLIKRLETMKLGTFVAISLTLVVIYTIAEMVVSSLSSVTHDTLTTCFFAVFGGEVVSCALIKIYKLKTDDSLEWEKLNNDE